jgi:hypothetical protein
MALAKRDSGDIAGARGSAKESVRIFNKLGVADTASQAAVDLLHRLEGGAWRKVKDMDI